MPETAIDSVFATACSLSGLKLDHSVASLVALDHVLDGLWAGDRRTEGDPGRWEALTDGAAAYVRDVLVRGFGGRSHGPTDPRWTVWLPNGTPLDPRALVRMRLEVGPSRELFAQVQAARAADLAPLGGGATGAPRWPEESLVAFSKYVNDCLRGGQPAMARRVLEKLLESGPSAFRAFAFHRKALTYLFEGKPELALAAIERAVATLPDSTECLVCQAQVLIELGRLAEAQSSLERAAAIDPRDPQVPVWLGELAMAGKMAQQALLTFNRALELDARSGQALAGRARALAALERNEEALEAADEALPRAPKNVNLLKLRADLLLAAGRKGEAVEALERALGAAPDDPKLMLAKARLEHELGRASEAMTALDRLFHLKELRVSTLGEAAALRERIGRDPERLRAEATTQMRAGRTDDAIATWRRLCVVAPGDVDGHRQLASALSLQGRTEEALAAFDTALAINPDDLMTLEQKAMTLARISRVAEAIAICDLIVARKSNDPEAFRRRGACLDLAGRAEDALADYRAATERDPHRAAGWYLFGIKAHALGRRDEARAALERVMTLDATDLATDLAADALARARAIVYELDNPGRSLDPHAAEPLRMSGFDLAARGLAKDALDALDKSLELDPFRGDAWHAKAVCLASLGRNDEAVDGYRRAFDLGAAFPQAGLALSDGLRDAGQPDAAMEVLERVRKRHADSPTLMREVAVRLVRLGRPQELAAWFSGAEWPEPERTRKESTGI
jgi:tetratricopeptide (TPR) repeat protein